ncbi:MFS transporter [Pseudomonas sp. NPDC089395]|uniref:MFS transporter n=2 Tax=Pseudomonas TaxID=286 RepID=UPI00382698E4
MMNTQSIGTPVGQGVSASGEALLFRKVLRRLLPFLFLAYFFSFLDRVNIGYAKLQMQPLLGFTDSQYGLAAGIFFLGYAFFEIPSNLLMEKTGARATLTRIMVLWGITSALTMFVSTSLHLYILRFFLGVFEAGFFPGVILYLSYWFPSYMRGRVTSLLLLATLAAPIVGGPISGLIMQNMEGIYGWAGWQWMFLLEALPIIFIGICCFFYLSDKPSHATWLTAEEKAIHQEIMVRDSAANVSAGGHGKEAIFSALTDPRVYLLAFLAFSAYCGSYAFNFWLPTMIQQMGIKDVSTIALYAVVPFSMAALGMLVIGRSSDLRRERRWHYALSMIFAAVMLAAASIWQHSLVVSLLLLGLAGFGFSGGVTVAWALPATYLKGRAAAAGIALVSSLATLSGFVAPWLIGVARDLTGSSSAGLVSISGMMLLSALAMIFIIPSRATYVAPNPN